MPWMKLEPLGKFSRLGQVDLAVNPETDHFAATFLPPGAPEPSPFIFFGPKRPPASTALAKVREAIWRVEQGMIKADSMDEERERRMKAFSENLDNTRDQRERIFHPIAKSNPEFVDDIRRLRSANAR